MTLTLRFPASILTPTGNGWVIRDGSKDFYIDYRRIHGTRKDGSDYLLKMNDIDVDDIGLRAYVEV